MSQAGLDHPTLEAGVGTLRRFFAATDDFPELRNPHIEPRVSDQVRASAKPAAVLLAVVDDPDGARLIVTRRHRNIRFAGHVCFPGGKRDESDEDMVATALRETHEEIGLAPHQVEVLGRLGDYYTQAGYLIAPVVGVVPPTVTLSANPGEVDAIYQISLARTFQAQNYSLTYHGRGRGHFSFHEGEVRIAGPTVSLMIGLYESLLGFLGHST